MTDNKDIRSLLTGLLFECPVGGNPESCQFCEQRQRPVAERIQFLRDMSEAETERHYASHTRCLRGKVGDD